jgi:muramoyltetrapeptide carboxypeptidase LdcA involved in peptidoglycan recycling
VVLANPKPFMGFSDTSTLVAYFAAQGLVTLYGPSVMAGFAQLTALPNEFTEHIRRMLFQDTAGYEYAPYSVWCEGYPDWREPENVGKVNELRENRAGWTWLQGDHPTEGEAWGGCTTALSESSRASSADRTCPLSPMSISATPTRNSLCHWEYRCGSIPGRSAYV